MGGLGDDTIAGSAGDDILEGNEGADKLKGGSGDDTIDGGTGNDLIKGGDGNDTISGGDGNDGIKAGDGNDRIIGGVGDDTISGGDGDDVAVYSGDMSDYRLDITNRTVADTYTSDGDDGIDTLKGDVETIEFRDGELTFSGDTEGEFRANTFTSNDQVNTSVDGLAGGGYVVVWQGDQQDGDGGYYNIYGQRYTNGGDPLGEEFRINRSSLPIRTITSSIHRLPD